LIYLKSAVVGFAALLLTAAIVSLTMLGALFVIFRPDNFDLPIVHVHTESLAFWLLVIVIFAAGFFWQFQRLSS
jgi:hypothetical protein